MKIGDTARAEPAVVQRIRGWSYRRQGLGGMPSSDDPVAVLDGIVAAYASQPTAILTLAARRPGMSAMEFARLDADRSAVRLPAMRGSAYLVPTEHVAHVFAATRWPAERLAWLWRGVGSSDDEYASVRAAIVEVAREPVSVAELRRRVVGPGAALLDRHPQAPTLLVRAIRAEGRLLSVAPASLRSNAFTYVATEAWLGAPLEPVPRADALAWLADAYLRAFGPARVDDYRWWGGLTPADAQKAMGAVPTVDLGGGLLLRVEDRAAFEDATPAPGDALDLLPLWDAYTMGYAPDGRSRFVRREHYQRAYGGGDGRALVLRAGRAVAAWGLRFAGRRMEVTVDFFEPLDGRQRRALDEGLARVAELLGAGGLSVTEGRLEGRGAPAG